MRKKLIEGTLIRIPLGDDLFAYGQILNKAEIAFFDFIGVSLNTAELENTSKKVLFVTAVMNYAVNSGRWERIGITSIPSELNSPREYFIQDIISNEVSIYTNTDGSIRSSNYAEAQGLECAAVWDAEHIENRLRDYASGKENIWLKSMQLK